MFCMLMFRYYKFIKPNYVCFNLSAFKQDWCLKVKKKQIKYVLICLLLSRVGVYKLIKNVLSLF